MTFQVGHIPAHKGAITTTDPILHDDIQAIRELLKDRPRDQALFLLQTSTALRSSDVVSLQWSQLDDDGQRISFTLRERKTSKHKRVVLAPEVSAALRVWQDHSTSDFVISGQRGGAMTVGSVGRLVKQWCDEVGAKPGRYAGHSLRKGRCRQLVDVYGVPLYQVMRLLQHSSELQTSIYLGKLTKEVAALYEHAV